MIRSKALVMVVALTTSTVAAAPPSAPAPSAPDAAPAPTAEDLSKAADATAAAAMVPSPDPAMKPAPALDDIDLASLGLDPTSSAFDDKLNIYGFADLSYRAVHVEENSPYISDTRSFISGNFNIYLSKNLTKQWRFLGEIRFLYLPNGGLASDGTVVTTAIGDPTDFERSVSWGGIFIERAYAEYDLTDYLTIRAGHYLTPYGIWNTDHGSPAIIAAYRPYSIGERYFPEHQTGLDLYGKKRLGVYSVSYHATVSNGRSPVESTLDPDEKLAFGGRLELEAPWAGTLKVGVSGYIGDYTGVPATFGATPESYKERSYGADAQWDHGGLLLQGELMGNQRRYTEGHRPLSTGGFSPDGQQWGGYALAGYRTSSLWNVMPFGFVEHLRSIDNPYYDHTNAIVGGLNFRPNASVVLKVQCTHTLLRGGPQLGDVTLDIIDTQLAVVF